MLSQTVRSMLGYRYRFAFEFNEMAISEHWHTSQVQIFIAELIFAEG